MKIRVECGGLELFFSPSAGGWQKIEEKVSPASALRAACCAVDDPGTRGVHIKKKKRNEATLARKKVKSETKNGAFCGFCANRENDGGGG